MVLTAAAVFDLDGTLVLTEAHNAEVWRVFLARSGVGLDARRLRQVTGRRALDSLAELAEELPDRLGDRTLAELTAELQEVAEQVPLAAVEEVPGAAALVCRLAAAGLPLALVTSAHRAHALRCLAELGVTAQFAVTVTAEDVRAGKPDPEGYLRACDRLGVRPADAVAFEDSPAGVAAVLAAGMRCVAVATTQPRSLLSRAHVVVDDLTDADALQPLLAAARASER